MAKDDKDPFTFSQFKRQKDLDKLRKKGRGEASEIEVNKPADGKKRKVFRPAVSRKPGSRKKK